MSATKSTSILSDYAHSVLFFCLPTRFDKFYIQALAKARAFGFFLGMDSEWLKN